jgi:hypothetical protein
MGIRTLLVGTDNAYYEQWTVPLFRAVHYYAPWLELHAHIVNPDKHTKLDYVKYTTEHRTFSSDQERIGYLQSVRFLVAQQYSQIMIVDADSMCTQSFTEEQYDHIVQGQTVLHHPKAERWLAGFIASDNQAFLQDYHNRLMKRPLLKFKHGWDQKVLKDLSNDYKFTRCPEQWMKVGKPSQSSIFMTLKGDQKISNKYLHYYNQFVK